MALVLQLGDADESPVAWMWRAMPSEAEYIRDHRVPMSIHMSKHKSKHMSKHTSRHMSKHIDDNRVHDRCA